MSRDLNIYGIDYEKLTTSTEEHAAIVGKADNQRSLLKIIDGLDYEAYEKSGIIELVAYRSKANCLAIAQVVQDYLECNYGQFESSDKLDTYPYLLLNKQQLLAILEWLVLLAQKLSLARQEIAPEDIMLKKKNKFLDVAIIKSYLVGKEFEWFGIYFPLYFKWYERIKESNYPYYYWEDSF